LSGVGRWREIIESTHLSRFGRWCENNYSYWLSCTHVISKIPTIFPQLSSTLRIRGKTTIPAVGTKIATTIRNDEQYVPNYPVQVGNEQEKKYRPCDEKQEEHTREIRNHRD